jgi:hypothetical protein
MAIICARLRVVVCLPISRSAPSTPSCLLLQVLAPLSTDRPPPAPEAPAAACDSPLVVNGVAIGAGGAADNVGASSCGEDAAAAALSRSAGRSQDEFSGDTSTFAAGDALEASKKEAWEAGRAALLAAAAATAATLPSPRKRLELQGLGHKDGEEGGLHECRQARQAVEHQQGQGQQELCEQRPQGQHQEQEPPSLSTASGVLGRSAGPLSPSSGAAGVQGDAGAASAGLDVGGEQQRVEVSQASEQDRQIPVERNALAAVQAQAQAAATLAETGLKQHSSSTPTALPATSPPSLPGTSLEKGLVPAAADFEGNGVSSVGGDVSVDGRNGTNAAVAQARVDSQSHAHAVHPQQGVCFLVSVSRSKSLTCCHIM